MCITHMGQAPLSPTPSSRVCRGNGASVLRIMPYAAIHYGAYEHYRAALLSAADRTGATQWLTSPATAHHAVRVSPIVDLLAGSGAGESAALLCGLWQGQAQVKLVKAPGRARRRQEHSMQCRCRCRL